jgi:hypothetical protein
MLKKVRLSEENRVGGSLVIWKFKDGKAVAVSRPMPNKVVSGSGGYGRNLILRALKGDTLYPLAITSASIGTGNTAAADSNTDLQTAVVTGISITNITITNNVMQVDVFVADGALPNGTYKEFGLFCGTQLLCRIIISPDYTKGTGEDTLFSYTLTLTG